MALLPRCELTVESSVDLPVAEIAMAKLTWFLRKVGDGGAVLTDAGYLKPAFVAAIRDELDWGLGWVGSSSREIDHHQVTDLREAVRHLGLTRIAKGRLLRTKLGESLATTRSACGGMRPRGFRWGGRHTRPMPRRCS